MEPLEIRQIIERVGGAWIGTAPPAEARVAELGTDSRTILNQSIFVALEGEKFDGHAYVKQARAKGALASIVNQARIRDLPRDGGPYIAVKDSLEALERIARWNRERLKLSVVAVTGSVGKTSTKEFLAAVLAGAFQVKSAPKSYNNRLGVATTLLSASPRTEILVVELGTSAPGEIGHLSRLVQPERIVLTEIAAAHLSGLGSLDGVVEAKSEVFEGLKEGGSAFVRDGVYGFERFKSRTLGPFFTFGWESAEPRSAPCDYAVTDCRRVSLGHDPKAASGCADYGYHFTINHTENFLLPVPGRHNVLNATAAIAVARDLGMSWGDIRSSLSTCRLPPLRLQVFEESGIVFMDDSYNANPLSMEAAISEWLSLKNGVRHNGNGGPEPNGRHGAEASLVAVLGDMLEMGSESRRFHEEIGKRLSATETRLLVTVGLESRYIGAAFKDHGGPSEARHFASAAEALTFLKQNLRTGDRVLFKGSRRIGLDVLASELRKWVAA